MYTDCYVVLHTTQYTVSIGSILSNKFTIQYICRDEQQEKLENILISYFT